MDVGQRAGVLLGQVAEIAEGLVADVWQHLPGYDHVRMELDDLAGVVAPNIEALLLAISEGRTPRGDELTPAVQLGERRAIQGVPIEAVVASWHHAERQILEYLITIGPPLAGAEHRDAARRLAAAVDVMTAVSTEAYRRARTEAAGHLEQIATDLVSRLAGGEPLDPLDIEARARLVGVAAQAAHRAVALAVDSDDPLVLARTQRAFLEALTPRLQSRVLVGSRDRMTIIVLPEVPGLVDILSRTTRRRLAGHPLVVGVGLPRRRLGETGGSCREAMAALDVGLRRGLKQEVVEFSSVVTDVLLIENPLDAYQVVHAALGPLLGRQSLLDTLRCLLENGLSVRATASALNLHENTVSYRVRQIIELLHIESVADLVRADILLALRALDLDIGSVTERALTPSKHAPVVTLDDGAIA